MAHPKLKTVRMRYDFCCGYCGASELDVGGDLTVDHFYPVSAGGDDSDDNLVYACIHCNQFKGALLPVAMNAGNQKRILHPLLDDRAVHIRFNHETGLLEGLTETGQYNIDALHLNRSALTANRYRKQSVLQMEMLLEQSLAEIREIKDQLEHDAIYISLLEARLQQLTGQNEE